PRIPEAGIRATASADRPRRAGARPGGAWRAVGVEERGPAGRLPHPAPAAAAAADPRAAVALLLHRSPAGPAAVLRNDRRLRPHPVRRDGVCAARWIAPAANRRRRRTVLWRLLGIRRGALRPHPRSRRREQSAIR